MVKIRRDMEESNLMHETVLNNLRRKHAEQLAEMSESIDNFQRLKQKLEKEKSEMSMEIGDLNSSVETLTKNKLSFEKLNRNLEDQINEYQTKEQQFVNEICELNSTRTQLQVTGIK